VRRPRILFVDDEEHILSALIRTLLDEPYDVVTASSAERALQIIEEQPFQVVVSDERMPGMDGATFLSILRERCPQTIRMMLTGHASVEATMQAVNNGEIYRFFTKPWDDGSIKLALRSAVEKFDLEDENRRLLKTVKRQSQELRALEKEFPGISEVTRDPRGAVELPEIGDDEIAAIIAAYTEGWPGARGSS
jgi:DNA-binding NtrC family response regulator